MDVLWCSSHSLHKALILILLSLLLIGCSSGGNTSSATQCDRSEFGCCPDGVTAAQGYEDDDGCPQG